MVPCNYLDSVHLNNFLSSAQLHNLSLMHCNCRSIANCFDSLLNLLLPVTCTPNIIAVTETWLNSSNNDLFQIPGYTFVSQPRPSPHGGVGIFVCNKFTIIEHPELNLIQPFLECLFVELNSPGNHNILVGCVYRPPNSDFALFNTALINILSEIDRKPFKTVAILGDFNLNLINYSTHPGTYEFVNNFQTYAYIPCINVPTRITERSQTLIDNIFVRCRSGIKKAAVLYYDLSDHLPIVAVLKTKLTFKTKKSTLLKRNFTDYALANFNEELSTPQLWDGLGCTSGTWYEWYV